MLWQNCSLSYLFRFFQGTLLPCSFRRLRRGWSTLTTRTPRRGKSRRKSLLKQGNRWNKMRLSTLLRMRLSPALREDNFARNLVRRNIGEFVNERSFWSQIARIVPFIIVTCSIGRYIEVEEQNRMSKFRDKSALFRGLNPDPENNPSWGYPYKDYKWKISEWWIDRGKVFGVMQGWGSM